MNPYDLAAVQAIQAGQLPDEFHRPKWSTPVRLMVDAASTPPTPPAAPAAMSRRALERATLVDNHPNLIRLTEKAA